MGVLRLRLSGRLTFGFVFSEHMISRLWGRTPRPGIPAQTVGGFSSLGVGDRLFSALAAAAALARHQKLDLMLDNESVGGAVDPVDMMGSVSPWETCWLTVRVSLHHISHMAATEVRPHLHVLCSSSSFK